MQSRRQRDDRRLAASCSGDPASGGLTPRILAVSWEVEGKDFKLYPGGGREWDWSETGMSHSPGIQPADVGELPPHGAAAVVLSQSMDKRLPVDPAMLVYLERQSVEVPMAGTREAVPIYNEFGRTIPIAGLFHSTY